MHDFSLRKRFVVGIVTPRKTILSHEQATKSAHHLARKQTVSQTNRKKPWGINQAMKFIEPLSWKIIIFIFIEPSFLCQTYQVTNPPNPQVTHQWHVPNFTKDYDLERPPSKMPGAKELRRFRTGAGAKVNTLRRGTSGVFFGATSLVNARDFCFVLGNSVGIWEFLGEFEVFLFCLLWFVFEMWGITRI